MFGVVSEEPHPYDFEVVLVNDGSPSDNSAEVCAQIAKSRTWVTFLDLSRNFGEHNAVMAGLNYCTGDFAVIMDDDFQNPPSEVIKLVDKLQEGYDAAFCSYDDKQHHVFRNLGSRFNNLVASILIDKPLDLYLCSFKAINRFLIEEIIKYDGPYPYVDGLILQITRRYASVEVIHTKRKEGRSGYSTRKLVSLWLNMFTNFSVLPLRLATLTGFALAALSVVGAILFAIEKFRDPTLPLGWASVIISVLLLASVQLFAIGMVGEYLGRMFLKINHTPQFVVREKITAKGSEQA